MFMLDKESYVLFFCASLRSNGSYNCIFFLLSSVKKHGVSKPGGWGGAGGTGRFSEGSVFHYFNLSLSPKLVIGSLHFESRLINDCIPAMVIQPYIHSSFLGKSL